MDAASNSSRQERGLVLAKAKARAFRQIAGDVFFVPSQTNAGSGYVVDVAAEKCSCPDFETTGRPCKHQWAVRYHRHEFAMADGTTIVTEKIKISYPQDWRSYNRAQCEEKERVQLLLRGLCDGIEQPPQKLGRPRFPLRDAIYAATMKVYGTMSGRRSTTDIKACEAAGHIKAPAYNTVFKYMEKPELLPQLTRLVEESARPLAAIERVFAPDGTGFASPSYVKWFDYKHGEDRRVQKWIQVTAMTGTKTNVITAVKVASTAGESQHFTELLDRTTANFTVREVVADKAYLSNKNLVAIEDAGARPFIPMKENSSPRGQTEAWERLYHLFALNREVFLKHYHQRSNVESTFSSLKRKFGANVRSKVEAAQFNEVLLKCLCHNLSMVTHAIHEFGVEPQFWLPRGTKQ